MTVALHDGIRLLSGHMFNYWDPDAGIVEIGDIANALSNVCRFAGHIPQFYSVAQHAVNTSLIVVPEHAFSALMHDTAEAFTNDLPTPLKAAVPMFKDLEVLIETSMSRRFGFGYPLSAEVRLADAQMLGLEKTHIKRDHSEWSSLVGVEYEHLKPLVNLDPMAPQEAKAAFLGRYAELKASAA